MEAKKNNLDRGVEDVGKGDNSQGDEQQVVGQSLCACRDPLLVEAHGMLSTSEHNLHCKLVHHRLGNQVLLHIIIRLLILIKFGKKIPGPVIEQFYIFNNQKLISIGKEPLKNYTRS